MRRDGARIGYTGVTTTSCSRGCRDPGREQLWKFLGVGAKGCRISHRARRACRERDKRLLLPQNRCSPETFRKDTSSFRQQFSRDMQVCQPGFILSSPPGGAHINARLITAVSMRTCPARGRWHPTRHSVRVLKLEDVKVKRADSGVKECWRHRSYLSAVYA